LTLKKYYAPSEITATVIVGSTPITGTCGVKTGVKQKFKIDFVTNTDEAALVQKNSGNPGYLVGYPLKLGFLDTDAEAAGAPVSVYQDGFEISGAD
jgi:hypothetical protein